MSPIPRIASVFIIPLFLESCKFLIPEKYSQANFDDAWEHIQLSTTTSEKPIQTDSTVIIYTNRVFHPERHSFLGDFIDSSGTSRPFLIVCKSGKWVVFPLKSIEEGILLINEKRNLVVYEEGMGKNFGLATARALGLSHQYGITVIMMDYPSINPTLGMHDNFKFSRQNAFLTAPYLVKLIRELQDYKKSGKDWANVKWTLFLHSMGNISLKRILEERMDSTLTPSLFELVVLNAPCVEEKNHSTWLKKCKLGKKLMVHYNKEDKQLRGASILLFKQQLGTKPRHPLADNAQYVDLNPLVGNRHSTFSDIPERPPIHPHARAYFKQIFNGICPDFNDSDQFGTGWKSIGVSLK